MDQLRILIADDHEMVRRGIRSVLETLEGVEIVEVTNGREAVDKTTALRPDLVILDLSMPILDGFAAASEIKRTSPSIPILILTLQKTDAFAAVADKIGVAGYLTKAETGKSLLEAVSAAIAPKTARVPTS